MGDSFERWFGAGGGHINRRRALRVGGLAGAGAFLAACGGGNDKQDSAKTAATAQGGAAPAGGGGAAAAPTANAQWDALVAAAKKEGQLVWSQFGGSQSSDNLMAKFQDKYGIRVESLVGRTGDFRARWDAERSAGKPTIDLRSSGSPENRGLAAEKLDQSFGELPELANTSTKWLSDPLVDVKAGNGFTLHYTLTNYYLLVNNRLVPESLGLKSYKDLADPKFKGMILLDEPIGPSPGSRWAAYTYAEYGDPYLKAVIANAKALSRQTTEAPKQIARGEYPIYIQLTQGNLQDIWELPAPRPFRIIVPEDGQMVLTGGISLLKDAPHPNAAKLFLNYLLTKEGQQILADAPGGAFIRPDVTPKVPEIVKFGGKFFPRNPDTFEFGSKQFFEWSAKAEPFLKESGLK